MDTYEVEETGRQRRRRHSAQFKASVVTECLKRGVSIAGIALRHGLNANMLRKWVSEHERGPEQGKRAEQAIGSSTEAAAFVPLKLPAASPAAADIRIELQRAGTTIMITWPASAAGDCAHWLRQWLR